MIKLRRWCVTVMDNWTPTREFFTMRGALRHAARDRLFPGSVHLWRWELAAVLAWPLALLSAFWESEPR